MAIVTSNWEHSDWRQQPTLKLKHAKAMLHEAEVRNAAHDVGSVKGRYQRLPPNYLSELVSEIRQMEAQIKQAACSTGRRPLYLKPKFPG